MQAILNDLLDVRWWFTEILVQLVIGYIGAYIYAKVAQRRNRRAAPSRESYLDLLVADPTMLMAHNLESIIRVGMFIVWFTALIYIRLVIGFTTVGLSRYFRGDTTVLHVVLPIFHFLVGAACGWWGYQAMSHVTVSRLANKRLLSRKSLIDM